MQMVVGIRLTSLGFVDQVLVQHYIHSNLVLMLIERASAASIEVVERSWTTLHISYILLRVEYPDCQDHKLYIPFIRLVKASKPVRMLLSVSSTCGSWLFTTNSSRPFPRISGHHVMESIVRLPLQGSCMQRR